MAEPSTDNETGKATDEDRAEAQRIVKASEFGARVPRWAWQRWLLVLVAVGWSLFQLYATYSGALSPQKLGAIHLAFGFALAFLAYPAKHGSTQRIPWYDWLLAIVGVATALYIVVNYYNLIAVQGGLPITRDVWMGSALLIALTLAASRIVGIALAHVSHLALLGCGPRAGHPRALLQREAGWPTRCKDAVELARGEVEEEEDCLLLGPLRNRLHHAPARHR